MVAGPLPKDVNGYSAAGIYDPVTNTARMWRGSNIGVDFADGNVVLYDSAGNPISSDPLTADAIASSRAVVAAAHEERFNGTTWDRVYNNTQIALLASAVRTTVTTTPVQTNYNSRGLWLFLNLTAVSVGGVKVSLNFIDPTSGVSAQVWQDATFITVADIYLFEFFIGGAAAASKVRASIARSLPRTWTATVTPGDANNQTYSLGGSYTSV